MGLDKHLRKALLENSLQKAEDPHSYAKLAREGLLLGHPVKIRGQDKRSDNNIPYHTTIKFFDKEKDSPHKAHKVASKLQMHPPHPELTEIEPSKIKSREGHDIYVIKLKGLHADKMKEHHSKFSHLGHKENYEFHPHISVPKEVHDRIKASGAKTAHEAGIEFGHAELRHGPKTLKTYKPIEKSEECEAPPLTKPYSSDAQRRWAHTEAGKKALGGEAAVHEWDEATKGKKLPEKVGKSEDLEKGAVKNMLTAGAMMGALASGASTEAKAPTNATLHPKVSASPNAGYSRDKILNAISQVESSGGKNLKHKPTSMGTAFGRFAEMPDMIHDTIRLNPDLKRKHGKALRLQGDSLHHYMQDNPGLEQELVNRHLDRLEHHFGHNPEAIAYAYNHGILGTNRALKAKQNIADHPYVKKFKQYYGNEK